MEHCEYHLHTELSLLDSCTNYKLYVDKAKELGMKAIAFTEHGNIYNWLEKKKYCEENGIKYIHGCEVYLTEQLEPKVRDNYHTVLLAKNFEGFKELNKLLKTSTDKQHMYYKNRITFDEFLAISDNIISTSACLASPLCRLPQDNPYYEKLVRKYTYLEIQPHVYLPQKDYNEKLINLAEKYNKELISGHDTHSLDKYKAECRSILKAAKNIHYDDEDKFDLTFKTTDRILDMYNEQGLETSVYTKAIENTMKMAESIESFTIDNSKKYPDLYNNEEELFKQEVQQALKDKISQGILTKNKLKIYIERINEEFDGYKETGMFSFILFMSELIRWCHKNNIPTGFSRGSCGGSLICYLLDIIDLDAIEWQTIFSRFVNKHRKALGDIDIDFSPDDRYKVYEYIINRFGNDKTCYILTTNTVADKGTIDEIGRALKYPLSKVEKIKKEYETNPEKTKEEYKELFYYFDGLIGTVISQGVHPAGIVASPITLSDNIGTFCYIDKKTKENKLVSMINMDEIHDLNFVKYDILGLKNVAIIRDTCKYINQKYPLSYNVNWNDEKVWNDMITSPVGIFQFEGNFAYDLLKRFTPHKINDLSLVNASLRPSGESYRDDLISKKVHSNPTEEINDLLKDNYGYLVFQEDTSRFLMEICGFDGGDADNIRRAICAKDIKKFKKIIPEVSEKYCEHSNKPKEQALEEVQEFLQILKDSSRYQFGYNHSTGYSMIGYICAYYRYYHPLEFIAAFLNNAKGDDDILNGTTLANEKNIKINPPKFGYSAGEYTPDKQTNSIYKGIGSIKYCNNTIGQELYDLKDNTYSNFLELLLDIAEKTSCNSRQIAILIKLGFFDKFGKTKYLYDIFEKFQSRYKKTHKDTTKQKRIEEIKEYMESLENKELPVSDIVAAELEYLGYISYIDSNFKKDIMLITQFKKNSYGTPFATLYRLCDGKTTNLKINKSFYEKNPIQDLDLIQIVEITKKNKRRPVKGKWTVLNEVEHILSKYSKVVE